ncbi:MAG TPA: catalase, partial [Crenalkalicoccus sp.]|nr:catalase [Crenalkalicoccus sp.]
MRETPGLLGRFAVIGLVLGTMGGSFAYAGGWLSPGRLTPQRIVDALSARGGDPVGHRRNHSKGICFTGTFEANGAGARLSTAPVLAAGHYPVVGRFAIATGDPQAPEATGRVRSMAIRVTAPDGQEWRSGMNNPPVFAVSTPQAFYEQAVAARVDPGTGKPDPQALQRFVAAHLETAAYNQWARTAPWTASYAEESYNSLNAFRFVDAAGVHRAVRWSMRTTLPQAAFPDLRRILQPPRGRGRARGRHGACRGRCAVSAPAEGFAPLQRGLHWLMAALILAMLFIGVGM